MIAHRGSSQEQVTECVRGRRHRRPIYARGLCVQCYTLAEEAGELDHYPDAAELDWLDFRHLRTYGIALEDVAARLGLEIRTALKYERRRRGTDYVGWLASLSTEDRERYGLPTVVSTAPAGSRPTGAHTWLRSLGIEPDCTGPAEDITYSNIDTKKTAA